MTTQERNKEIALMLNWKYVSSIDIKEKKYSESIFAGWWSNIPNVYHVKVNRNLYRGRGLNDLSFDSDWNWLIEAVEFIEKLKMEVSIIQNECSIIDIEKAEKEENPFMIESVTKCFDGVDKKEAVFIAVSDFAKLYNEKKL
jgi:hypothetical protein